MSTDLKKEKLFDQLYQSLDEEFGDLNEGKPLGDWALSVPIILDGKSFSFDKHEYLKDVYGDSHIDQCFMKATQLGLSTLALLRAFHGSRYLGYKGVLYLMPSRSDALDVAKGRVNPLVEQNAETLGQWIRETDSASLKQIWGAFVYFRGMRSRTGLKSVPIDFLVCDELDEAVPAALDMAYERMAHSEHKHILKLSNPTLPDYGIDRAFQETDQRFWLLKCNKCNEYTCLEDTFPACLIETKDKVIRACQKCKAELNPSVGQWVPKKPGVTDKRGYHFSQLFSHYVDPGDILRQFRTTDNLQDFWNLKIGNSYIEAENRLSVQEVLDLCGNEGIASSDPGPCYLGCDQGKDLHVVIGKRHPGRGGKIIHIGVYKDWEELDGLVKNFNVSRAVVDALPEMRNARGFAERHKGRVYLSYYSIHQKGSFAWNEKNLTVTSNRAESLDASHKEIQDSQLVLPRNCEIVREFAKHMHNVAKKIEENEETGSKRYVYVKLGADHFRHAQNYECMARSFGKDSAFSDIL